MKPEDDAQKQDLEKQLSEASQKYFELLERLVEEAPHISVSISPEKKKKLHYPVFLCGDSCIELPNSSGVYFVYQKGKSSPFYCGESTNIRQRLTYHFSDWDDAVRNSTLKKKFDKELRTLEKMSEMLTLKVVEVPVVRNDVEDYFHEKFKINTKRDKCKRQL